MSSWLDLLGTAYSKFQLGFTGPLWRAVAGAFESRNAGDTAYAVVRGASPVGPNDFTTKQYVDNLATRFVIAGQFNGGNALPANTSTEQYFVVTTTGANASIGDLIWDDGTGTGTAVRLTTTERLIMTQTALTGGTISFSADSLYWWDTATSAWLNVGGSTMSGAIRTIRMAITNAASQSSTQVIPANAYILETYAKVTTPFSPGSTFQVGRTGSTALAMTSAQNLATVAGEYSTGPTDIAWGASALPVLVSVGGSPAAGAGVVVVKYTVPDV